MPGFCPRAHSAALQAHRVRRSCGPRPCATEPQALGGAGEDRGVVAHNSAATQRREADVAAARARRSRRPGRAPTAGLDRRRGPRRRPRPSISAVPEGASTFRLWCISTISRSQSSPSLFATRLTECREQIDAEAHVAGLHHDGAPRAAVAIRASSSRGEAGRADDVDEASPRRKLDQDAGGGRDREVDQRIGLWGGAARPRP